MVTAVAQSKTELLQELERAQNACRALASAPGRAHYDGIDVVVTYHPAAVFRNPALRKPLREDLKKARRLLAQDH